MSKIKDKTKRTSLNPSIELATRKPTLAQLALFESEQKRLTALLATENWHRVASVSAFITTALAYYFLLRPDSAGYSLLAPMRELILSRTNPLRQEIETVIEAFQGEGEKALFTEAAEGSKLTEEAIKNFTHQCVPKLSPELSLSEQIKELRKTLSEANKIISEKKQELAALKKNFPTIPESKFAVLTRIIETNQLVGKFVRLCLKDAELIKISIQQLEQLPDFKHELRVLCRFSLRYPKVFEPIMPSEALKILTHSCSSIINNETFSREIQRQIVMAINEIQLNKQIAGFYAGSADYIMNLLSAPATLLIFLLSAYSLNKLSMQLPLKYIFHTSPVPLLDANEIQKLSKDVVLKKTNELQVLNAQWTVGVGRRIGKDITLFTMALGLLHIFFDVSVSSPVFLLIIFGIAAHTLAILMKKASDSYQFYSLPKRMESKKIEINKMLENLRFAIVPTLKDKLEFGFFTLDFFHIEKNSYEVPGNRIAAYFLELCLFYGVDAKKQRSSVVVFANFIISKEAIKAINKDMGDYIKKYSLLMNFNSQLRKLKSIQTGDEQLHCIIEEVRERQRVEFNVYLEIPAVITIQTVNDMREKLGLHEPLNNNDLYKLFFNLSYLTNEEDIFSSLKQEYLKRTQNVKNQHSLTAESDVIRQNPSRNGHSSASSSSRDACIASKPTLMVVNFGNRGQYRSDDENSVIKPLDGTYRRFIWSQIPESFFDANNQIPKKQHENLVQQPKISSGRFVSGLFCKPGIHPQFGYYAAKTRMNTDERVFFSAEKGDKGETLYYPIGATMRSHQR